MPCILCAYRSDCVAWFHHPCNAEQPKAVCKHIKYFPLRVWFKSEITKKIINLLLPPPSNYLFGQRVFVRCFFLITWTGCERFSFDKKNTSLYSIINTLLLSALVLVESGFVCVYSVFFSLVYLLALLNQNAFGVAAVKRWCIVLLVSRSRINWIKLKYRGTNTHNAK